jgi:hypothetical protein
MLRRFHLLHVRSGLRISRFFIRGAPEIGAGPISARLLQFLAAMWTGRTLKRLPKRIVSRTLQQYRLRSPKRGSDSHFTALKRLLDRREPDYAD